MSSPSPIGTVINFCSNDYPFLRHCIDAIKPFSSQILIPVCDHFFDGKKEEREILNGIYAENPDVQFIEFPYDAEKSFYSSHSSATWHNLARLIGRYFLDDQIEYVLFLDCDEIVETQRFIQWLEQFPYHHYDALRFLNYWYFRETDLRATRWENSPLLVKKKLLDGAALMDEGERAGIFGRILGAKILRQSGLDGNPLFHHYSWVRTREQLLRKVVSWGHNRDRDWVSKVEEEFSRPFNGTDFVHGYTFEKVSPYVVIDINNPPKAAPSTDFPHVRTLSHADLVKIDVSLTYQIPLSVDARKPSTLGLG